MEYYNSLLYNYSNIDKLIDEIKDGLINSVNVSGSEWRKGITVCNNTLENQVIKIIENKKILELKRWQVLIKKVLAFSGFPHYNKYTRCRCEMNRETQNLVTCYDLRRQSYRELASDAAFLSAYAGIRISMGMI